MLKHLCVQFNILVQQFNDIQRTTVYTTHRRLKYAIYKIHIVQFCQQSTELQMILFCITLYTHKKKNVKFTVNYI